MQGNYTFLSTVLAKLPQDLLLWELGGGLLTEFITIMSHVPSLIQDAELSKYQTLSRNSTQELQEKWLPRLHGFRNLIFSNKAQSENIWEYSAVTESFMSSKAVDLLGAAERLLDLQDSTSASGALLHNDRLSRVFSSSSQWFDQLISS
jgi:hypothetical protein